MDWDWIPIGIMMVMLGGFYVWSLYLAFKQGVEVGKRLVTPSPQRDKFRQAAKALSAIDPTPRYPEKVTCDDCGVLSPNHHPDCPKLNAKPKPDRRRWMGFSRIKAELESKESA